MPAEFGHWHTIYARMRGWARQGVLARVFEALQVMQLVQFKVEICSLDSTSIKVHPDGTGALKNGPQSIGRSRGGLTAKIHLAAANERTACCFALSPGQAADGPEGRKLLTAWKAPRPASLRAVAMDRAYAGNETRQLVLNLGLEPVVPPMPQCRHPWEYDRELYKRRNEVERLFRRLKAYRRIFSRFEKLDEMFTAFIHFALIAEGLFYINTP